MLYIGFALTPSHLSVLRSSHQRNSQRRRGRRQFHFFPCTSIYRNAGGAGECNQYCRAVAGVGRQRSGLSETVECVAAFVGSTIVDERRRAGWARCCCSRRRNALSFTSSPGCCSAVPCCLLLANKRTIAGKAAVVNDLSSASWRAITLMSTGELLVAAYGGYFGAGIGFIILEVANRARYA